MILRDQLHTSENIEDVFEKFLHSKPKYKLRNDGKYDLEGYNIVIDDFPNLPFEIGKIKGHLTILNTDNFENIILPEEIEGMLTIRDCFATKINLEKVLIKGSLLIFNCCFTNIDYNSENIDSIMCNMTFIQDLPDYNIISSKGNLKMAEFNPFLLNRVIRNDNKYEDYNDESVKNEFVDDFLDDKLFLESCKIIDYARGIKPRGIKFHRNKITEIRKNIYQNLIDNKYDYEIDLSKIVIK